MRILKAAVVIFSLLMILSPVAVADETSATSASEDWKFTLAPMYLWAVSIDGDQTLRGNKVDLDVSFGDIWDNLNGALILHFEGLYRQRWGFISDLNYIALNPEESTPLGDIDIDFTETIFELAGFYRFTKGIHVIDGFGGLRYSAMDVEIDFPGPVLDIDQNKDWVDPYVGLRWHWRFAENLGLNLRGDIGGFGIGSDLTWNLVGLVDFRPWEHVSLFGGYRAFYQDYSDGSGNNKFAFDATMQGPILGLKITW